MVRCLQCARKLPRQGQQGSVSFFTGGIMGDEYAESYYLCPHCEVYTIEVYRDRFLGEDNISLQGAIS